jgi:CRP-like cAMP-binding protein
MKLNGRKKQNGFELFEPTVFLKVDRIAGRIATFQNGERVFSRGDAASSLLYIKQGDVELSRSNGTKSGFLVSLFSAGDIFGEECLVGRTRRKGTATVTSPTTLLVVRRDAFLRALRENPELSHQFIAYLLARNFRMEECLVESLGGSAPKRLPTTVHAMRNVPK